MSSLGEVEAAVRQKASQLWSNANPTIDDALVASLLAAHGANPREVAALEESGYLESYLWPLLPLASATHSHLLSIALICNEKSRQNLPIFDTLSLDSSKFQSFVEQLVSAVQSSPSLPIEELITFVTFLVYAYQHLENSQVRKLFLKYISLPLWESLSKTRLDLEFESAPPLKIHFEKYLESKAEHQVTSIRSPPTKKRKKSKTERVVADNLPIAMHEGTLFPHLLKVFFEKLHTFEGNDSGILNFILKFAELTFDLLTQIPTRRFWNAYIDGE